MGDADYEYEDICLCGHSLHVHEYTPGAYDGWGHCHECDCEWWRP